MMYDAYLNFYLASYVKTNCKSSVILIHEKPEIWWGSFPTALEKCCESNSRWKGLVGLITYMGEKYIFWEFLHGLKIFLMKL